MLLNKPEVLLDSFYVLQFIFILHIAAVIVIVMPGNYLQSFPLSAFFFFFIVIIIPTLNRITFGIELVILTTILEIL